MSSNLPPEWPPILDTYPWLPCAYPGPLLAELPDLLVIHSGEVGTDVAWYLHRTIRADVESGHRDQASAHFSWRGGWEHGHFCQGVSLQRVAHHAGGSRFRGRVGVNRRSWSIELPGPARARVRPDIQRVALRALVCQLALIQPRLTVTAHQWIDPGKRDPGPGVDVDWFDELGVDVVWKDVIRMGRHGTGEG